MICKNHPPRLLKNAKNLFQNKTGYYAITIANRPSITYLCPHNFPSNVL